MKKPNSPLPVFEEYSKERTHSDVQGEDMIQNDEDDTTNNTAVPLVLEPPTIEASPQISRKSDIFENMDPFLILSQTPQPSLFLTYASPMTMSVPNSSIPSLPKFSSVNTSQP